MATIDAAIITTARQSDPGASGGRRCRALPENAAARPVRGTVIRHRQALLLALLLSCAAPQVHGVAVSSVVREAFAVRPFGDLALPQSTVRQLQFSRDGFLWAGTRAGLLQYRAGQRRVWRQGVSAGSGLPSGMINDLLEDPEGVIWAATPRGVAYLAPADNDFRTVPQPNSGAGGDSNVVALVLHGKQLIGATRNGHLLAITRQGVRPIAAATAEADRDAPLPLQTLSAAASDGRDLYLGTESNGVYRLALHGDHYRRREIHGPGDVVVGVAVCDDTLIWLSRDRGLTLQPLDRPAAPPTRIDPRADETQGYYRAMHASGPDSAWFAAGPHLIRLRDGELSTVTLPGRGNEVRSISVDRVGNV